MELFAQAMQIAEEEGADRLQDFLNQHPDESPWLRCRLDLIGALGMLSSAADEAAEIPEQLGEFRLLRRLGQGGMGVVYLAEQPSLQRQVAIKVIRPEQMFFPEAKTRFQREVATAARLEHPGIVRVYSSGEAQGVPYFIMERVEGVSLDQLLGALVGIAPDSLDDHTVVRTLRLLFSEAGLTEDDLPTPDGTSWVTTCFRWMAEFADALLYAHRHGVLHRDLKPSNVMVSTSSRLVLLDFGLAHFTGAAKITRSGAVLGSLAYMAPEQIVGDTGRIQAWTDVYGFGVMLYEMLALRHPFLQPGGSDQDTRTRILQGISSPLRERNRAIPWDADTVCKTAMEIDPTRRYATIADLCRDLGNVLAKRPIEARRPGIGLRLRRLAERHPAWTVGAVLGFLLVVVGPTAFAVREYFVRLEIVAAKETADLELEIRRETLRFLNEDLLEAVRPDALGKDASMRLVLDTAAARIEDRFPDQPRVEASIQVTIGNTYRLIGLFEAAEHHLARGHALNVQALGEEHPASLEAAHRLAMLYEEAGKLAAAEELALEVFEARQRLLGREHQATLESAGSYAIVLARLRRFDEAEPFFLDTFERLERTVGPDHRSTLAALGNLGFFYKERGDLAAAASWIERALEAHRRVLGEEHPDTLVAWNNWADLKAVLGEVAAAEEAMQRMVAISTAALGADHPITLGHRLNLGSICLQRGDVAGAEVQLQQLLESPALSDQHPMRLQANVGYSTVLGLQQRLDEARALLETTLKVCQRVYGPTHKMTKDAQSHLAGLLVELGETDAAASICEEALENGTESITDVEILLTYSTCLEQLGAEEQAGDTLLEALALLEEIAPGNQLMTILLSRLLRHAERSGDEDAAADWRARLAGH